MLIYHSRQEMKGWLVSGDKGGVGEILLKDNF